MSAKTMSKIRTQSTILNTRVDEQLARRAAELRDAKVPMEFWWGAFEERGHLDENGAEVFDCWKIGLMEVGPGDARLSAKLVRYEPSTDSLVDLDLPISLAEAPFNLRLKAAECFDSFLDALASELMAAVSKLDGAFTARKQ
jgi:hypothetical protein